MILDILNSLEATNSRNEKEAILNKHADNSLLKRVFELAYHPRIQFNIRQIPELSPFDFLDGKKSTLAESLDVIVNAFVVEVIRGNKASEILRGELSKLSHEDQVVLSRIIKRDLRVGCTANTINKIWKDTIPQQPCMLAQSQSDKSLANIKYPAIAQLKADGSRCMAIVENGSVSFVSRAGKPFTGLKRLESWLTTGRFDGFVLDGELVYMTDGVENRTKTNGIVNKASKGTISDKEQKQLVFQVWDIIPVDLYWGTDKTANVPYHARYDLLKTELAKLFYGESGRHPIQAIPSFEVSNLKEAQALSDKYIAEGLEGIILKNRDGLWMDGRSKDQVKFKDKRYADMRIVDIIEGTGKLKGKLGAFVIMSEDGKVKCQCGIGDKDTNSMTDKLREEYYNNRENIIDTIGEFSFNGFTKPQGSDTYSLFLPRFVRFRDDKTVANTMDNMQ